MITKARDKLIDDYINKESNDEKIYEYDLQASIIHSCIITT